MLRSQLLSRYLARLQASSESEQLENPLVSYFHCNVLLALTDRDDQQTQHSGSGFFTNGQNINGGTFVSKRLINKRIYFIWPPTLSVFL